MFLKKLFSSTDKNKTTKKDDESQKEARNDDSSPYETRRKMSVSKSGRLKQSFKKRRSITDELFGEDIKKTDKNAPIKYHVHGKNFLSNDQPVEDNNNGARKSSHNLTNAKDRDKRDTKLKNERMLEDAVAVAKRRTNESITAEEAQHEIDDAFKAVESATE